jgi:hypothetical protein
MLLLSFVWFDCVPHFGGRAGFKAVLMPTVVVFRISVLGSAAQNDAQVQQAVPAVNQAIQSLPRIAEPVSPNLK